jgi:hypothetical protein
MEDAPVVDTAMRNFDVHVPERGFFYLAAATPERQVLNPITF